MPDLKQVPVVPGKQDKDLIAVIRSRYPKYDKALHSKVKRPQIYGICLQDDAEQLICQTFDVGAAPSLDVPEARRVRHNGGHKHRHSAGCRLPEERVIELQDYISGETKYRHISELVDGLLVEYAEKKRREKNGEHHCRICDNIRDLMHVDGVDVCRSCAAKISISLDG